MENFNYNISKNQNNNHQSSKLSITLRKKKLNQKLNEFNKPNESKLSKPEEENQNLSKLFDLSKTLFEQKEIDGIINILDKIYFFLINIKIPLKPNFIKLSGIIPNLSQKIALFEREENILKKIFDVFDELIKSYYLYGIDDKYSSIINEQHFQLIFRLIELYQNDENMMKIILNFLSNLIAKSNYIKEYLMKKPGCYFIQSILSLDDRYPSYIVQLLYSFCNYENLNDITMKDFEIMFIKECNKIITYFYKENENDPQIVINNKKLFQNLYSCLAFISISEIKEIRDILLINDKNNNTSIFDKIISFEKYDRENLSEKVLKILINILCYSEDIYIPILIENNSYQYIIDRLFDKLSSEKIIHEASFALANFVNSKLGKKIFIEKNYLDDIINKIRNNNSYQITKDLLSIISNFFFAIDEIEIISFIDSDIFSCCTELLMKTKEPTLLNYVLIIIEMILYKGDPNSFMDDYYIEDDDKILNPFRYRFDIYGLTDILSNILINSKNEQVCNSIERLLNHYYKEKKNNK